MSKEELEKQLENLRDVIRKATNFANNCKNESEQMRINKEIVDLLKLEERIKEILKTKYGVVGL